MCFSHSWYCCYWLTHVLDVFKDVIHTCPKCNKQIAIYNRFFLFKKAKGTNDSNNEQTATTQNSSNPTKIGKVGSQMNLSMSADSSPAKRVASPAIEKKHASNFLQEPSRDYYDDNSNN